MEKNNTKPQEPTACTKCNAVNICECNGYFAHCPHGKEMMEFLNELRELKLKK